MHFEILVEDASGKILLEHIVPKVMGEGVQQHSWRIHAYKGIGHLPRNLRGSTDPAKRILLDRLPQLLRGYGKSLHPREQHAVIVVADSDSRPCEAFKRELLGVLETTEPAPRTLFRIAVEEMEAWLLGDPHAVLTAYPKARTAPLNDYRQDSVCGTWEVLAEAIYPGGASELKRRGFPVTGQMKCQWARDIAPFLDIHRNASPSFAVFRESFNKLIGGHPA